MGALDTHLTTRRLTLTERALITIAEPEPTACRKPRMARTDQRRELLPTIRTREPMRERLRRRQPTGTPALDKLITLTQEHIAQQKQGSNAYSQWGSSVVSRGNQSAYAQHYSTAQGTVGSVQGSGGGRAVGTSTAYGNSVAGKSSNGDLYAGHNGSVYKNTGSGWQQYNNGSWNSVNKPTSTSTDQGRPSSSQFSGSSDQMQGLQNDSQDRQRASQEGQRSQDFQKSGGGWGGSSGWGNSRWGGGGDSHSWGGGGGWGGRRAKFRWRRRLGRWRPQLWWWRAQVVAPAWVEGAGTRSHLARPGNRDIESE
jgi:hypothetical protein